MSIMNLYLVIGFRVLESILYFKLSTIKNKSSLSMHKLFKKL